jgi:hypothetical protein
MENEIIGLDELKCNEKNDFGISRANLVALPKVIEPLK